MKKLLLLLIFITYSTYSFSQKLTLAELISLCDKQNWESVNSNLSAKGWVYHDSKKGDDYNYNTITWSYNKDRYTDKAQGWFYVFTYDSSPNKISYVILNKALYTSIQGSISSSGFKLTKSSIEDGEVVSTYTNAAYILKISTQKRDDDNWSDASLTAYQITLIKKAGIYDPDNGKKFSYYEDGEIESEYTLKDGELHGILKSYYENGKLQKQGNYTNGNGNGKFAEYDEEGNKVAEYAMLNSEPHGIATLYKNGLKFIEKEYAEGTLHGKFLEYHYDEDDKLSYKIVGTNTNGEKEGKWVAYFVRNGEETIAEYRHYKNGLKHGDVKEYIGTDTIETATYANGLFDGPYERQILQRLYDMETGDYEDVWVKESEGLYKDDERDGHWIYYDFIMKNREGNYKYGKKEGKWIYYLPVSERTGEIMLESNFVADVKQGLEKRFFFIDEIDDSADGERSTKFKSIPVNVTQYFKNGLRNGDYEHRDSTNTLVDKGTYLNDEKHGQWIEGYIQGSPDGSRAWLYFAGEYKNGVEEGRWISYFDKNLILTTSHYRTGKLHGEYMKWNKLGKPAEKKIFDNGDLKELTIYDSVGEKIMSRYEIYNEKTSSLICRQSEHLDDKIISQEYKIFRQEEIPHAEFERVFLNLTGIISSKVYGYKDGEYKMTTQSGELLIKGNYLKEDKIGVWTYTYPSQQVVMELNFEKGQVLSEKYLAPSGQPFSGEFLYHDAATGLKEERKIKNGLRNGRTSYLDSNNKVVKKENYKEGVLKGSS